MGRGPPLHGVRSADRRGGHHHRLRGRGLAGHGNHDPLCEVLQLSLPGLQPKSGGLCHCRGRDGGGRAGRCDTRRRGRRLAAAGRGHGPARTAAVPQDPSRPHRSDRVGAPVQRHLDAPPLPLSPAHRQRHPRHGARRRRAGGLALVLRLHRPHDRRHLPPQRPAGRNHHLHRSEVGGGLVRGKPSSRRSPERTLPRGRR